MAKFTADLRNLQRLVRQMKSPKPIMQSGLKTIDLLSQNWDKGQGGDGRVFAKKISATYAARKAKAGRKPIVNLSWTGDMRRAMTVVKKRTHKADVTFSDTASMNKARGNFELRPTMMKIGAVIRKKVIEHFYREMKKA